MKPLPSDITLKEITKYYEREYFSWSGEGEPIGYQGIYRFFYWHRIFADLILRLKPKSVLNLGGAYGHIVKLLENEGVPALNIDVSNFASKMRVTNSFIRASITHMPLRDNSFDLGVCMETMEHIPEAYTDRTLDEIARVCKRCWFGIAYREIDEQIWGEGGKREITHVNIKPFQWWEDKLRKYNGRFWQIKKDKRGLPPGTTISIPKGGEKKGLNVGCFINMTVNTEDTKWINLDILDLNKYAETNGYNFLQHDARKGLPFPDNYFNYIISSHFLEHLTYSEGLDFLRECFRVLKPEGLIRISIPDTEKLTRKYLDRSLGDYDIINPECEKAETQIGKLSALLLGGHKSIYDEAKLVETFDRSGFNATRKAFNETGIPSVFDFHPTHSLYVEARKPKQVITTYRKRRLKIALLSTPYMKTPPDYYGGLERVVADLAAGLSELGHDVTLFATKGSMPIGNYNLVETVEPVLKFGANWAKVNWFEKEREMYEIYKDSLDDFDIIHGHGWWCFEYIAKMNNPRLKVCHTHHGGWSAKTKPRGIDQMNLIAVSRFMTEQYMKQGFTAKFVYNGIDLKAYPFKGEKGDRLIFVGRFVPFKQPHVAIEVAKKLGLGLDLVGGAYDPEYFSKIKRMCNGGQIKLHTEVLHKTKVKLLQNAKALIFPSDMGEPFGLVAVEALATGTPVVATSDGAIPEIIRNEVNGFLCNSVGEISDAIKKVTEINPESCRKSVEADFSREIMGRRYLNLYRKILNGEEW